MFSYKDFAVGIASILLGVLIVFESRGLVAKTSLDPAGPAALPLMMAWSLIVLGAIEVVGGLYARGKTKADRPPSAGFKAVLGKWYERYRLVLIVMIIGAAFCALFDLLGYLIAVPLMFAAILWFMERRDLKSIIGINLAVTAFLFVVFKYALSVNLPLGPFSGLF